MKFYDVTIKATVYKTVMVSAENPDAAAELAHELFTVLPDESNLEHYDQETVRVVEAQS